MTRHAVLLVAYNNLSLTKDAVNSVLAQDIGPLDVYLIDNGSTDGTREYFSSVGMEPHTIHAGHWDTNISPNIVTNHSLEHIFQFHDKVLGVANDLILPPNMYRLMNQWPRGMVTASQNPNKDFPRFEQARAVSECTPFALILLRKWCYEALLAKDGHFFDEKFFCYASDCDLALRMAACGIRGVQLDVQYYHYGSATWKLAPEAERNEMLKQADRDRAYFKQKHGFAVDSLEYGQVAQDPNWRA